MGALLNFIEQHKTVLGMIEKAGLEELLKLLTALYPNDPVIMEIAAKVVDEIEKLQGLQTPPPAS